MEWHVIVTAQIVTHKQDIITMLTHPCNRPISHPQNGHLPANTYNAFLFMAVTNQQAE